MPLPDRAPRCETFNPRIVSRAKHPWFMPLISKGFPYFFLEISRKGVFTQHSQTLSAPRHIPAARETFIIRIVSRAKHPHTKLLICKENPDFFLEISIIYPYA